MKLLKLLILTAVLLSAPIYSQVNLSPSPDIPSQPVLDFNQLKEWISNGSNDEIIAWFGQEIVNKTPEKIVSEFATTLTIDELNKLYAILIETTDQEWTEGLALKIRELRDQKVKVETPPLCEHPRVVLIAQSREAAEFWIILSDGSSWSVEPSHFGGDNHQLHRVMINSILGDYVVKHSHSSGNQDYPYLFETLSFPKCDQ